MNITEQIVRVTMNGDETKAEVIGEVKLGKWIYDEEAYAYGNPYGHYECDQCGEYVPHKTNFCPNCGADMRKETEDAKQ